MTPDLLSRFTSRKNLSPNRLNQIIAEQSRETFDDVWKALDPNISRSFLSNTLRWKKNKFTKFSKQVETLLGEYTALQLSRMDENCIKNDGGIDIVELDKILFEE